MRTAARASIVALAMVAMSATGLVTAPAAHAATCSGGGCTGKDPVSMGCDGSGSRVRSLSLGSGVGVYLVYSSKCKAFWALYVQDSPLHDVGVSLSVREVEVIPTDHGDMTYYQTTYFYGGVARKWSPMNPRDTGSRHRACWLEECTSWYQA